MKLTRMGLKLSLKCNWNDYNNVHIHGSKTLQDFRVCPFSSTGRDIYETPFLAIPDAGEFNSLAGELYFGIPYSSVRPNVVVLWLVLPRSELE